MNGITHKQAQRYLRMDLDGLLSEAQRLDLETHLRACEACRAESAAFSRLTTRLQAEFHSRWDLRQDGPSQNVLANIRTKSRRIMMQKRVDFAFNIFGGILTLLVLFFAASSVISQFTEKSTTSHGTQTSVPASAPEEERLLAFTSRQSGNLEIYTVRSDGSDMRNITNHPADDVNPYWSPDGKQIAFQSGRNSDYYSQIFLMDADGSHSVPLTTDKGNHEFPLNLDGKTNPWSPDGSKLLFLRQGLSEGEWILQSIDINTGNITSLATGRFVFSNVSWSPDGKHIGFVVNAARGQFVPQIHVVRADGTNLINISSLLPSDETIDMPYNHSWSGDGESIFFTTSNLTPENTTLENGTWKIYEAGIDGSLTLQATTRSPIGGAWNGVYFISPIGSGGWTWMYPDGSFNTINPTKECEQARLYDSGANSYTSAVANFSRSPNGNGVIIASCPDGNVHLSWADSAGTEIKPIAKFSTAPTAGYLDWVRWSQDEQFIAFHIASPNTTNMDVYIVDIPESLQDPSLPPVKISLGRSEFPYLPAWQPVAPVANEDINEKSPTPEPEKTSLHEGLITFTSEQNGNYEIYTIRADGSNLTNLTSDPSQDNAPIWSPDHSKIAFASDRNGNIDILTMNPDGSDLTRLTNNSGDDIFLAWSQDGQQIIYLAGRQNDDLKQVTVMNADGSRTTPLASEAGHYYFQGWSPDSKHILYVEPNLTSNGSYEDLSLHIVSTDGANAQEWTLNNFEMLRWEDAQHFLGVVREVELGKWSLYRFSIDGTQAILSSYNDPLAGSFEKAIVVERQGSLQWLALQGESIPQATWNFASFCQAPAGVTQQVSLSISSDRKQAVAVLTCQDARWLYLVSADGKTIKKLGSQMENSSEILINWLSDGRSATMLVFKPKGSSASLYLLDLQKMQAAVSMQPVLLTTEAVHPYQGGPPSRIGN